MIQWSDICVRMDLQLPVLNFRLQKYPAKSKENIYFEWDYKYRKMIFECEILCTYDAAPYIWYVVKFAFKNVP